ncbi:hypothetical protein JG687_00002867 [Phytophthora cactorum]|uniref:Helicase-associated domain-containing protein n=1 Tax=Phytophthora cactorum TaxID=29920 RepID=A0A329SDG8_9STRA|nr:hypothetical protein PC111_g19651 [Phytophthora cactorum]KAG2831306.1 hypothetical protein PC112_g7339 [Phytophthora cactorum]KAG2888703.1 hypothetical protein PC115_g19961 [Phytophthora cactorum]KAG2946716.1 hypothetical protein PC117_g7388 [Phytophthora cactorum]KAG3011613.1 hypothetical protein PC119_g13172 [Phytophthora cactorum]
MLLVAPRRCLRVGALRLAPAPIHLVSSSTPRLQCKREGVRFFSSDPPACGVPSVAVPFSDTVWEKTVNPALRTFLKLRNHAMVPISFVVPTDDDRWAEETRGYPLGKHAEWLRRRWRARKELPKFTVEDLKELDFAFDWSQYKWNHFVKPALRRYYELNEHTDVPQLFRIEHGDAEWPEKLWGYFLGPRVFNIRHRGDFKVQIEEDAQEMAEINFCYDSTTYDRDWRERVLPSLQVFRQEFGHCDVHRSFKVPDCPPWPKGAAGILLGVTVNNIRSKGYFAEQVARDDAELKTVEFVWDHSFTEWNDRIFPALETFKRKKGHCHVMKYFVVPSTEPWPEKSHGLKLGTVINNIRSYSNYFDRTARNVDRLASVGFDLQIAQLKWDRRVEPMLDTFEELHGHRNVPTDFVVPSEAPWQKSDWGIQLGKLKLKGKYM